ncbi:MAG: hypothetical protein ACRCTO_24755, partial [Pseudomonas paracarnis]
MDPDAALGKFCAQFIQGHFAVESHALENPLTTEKGWLRVDALVWWRESPISLTLLSACSVNGFLGLPGNPVIFPGLSQRLLPFGPCIE